MATNWLSCYTDNWFATINGSNYGNGAGNRLQVGAILSGGDQYVNRAGLSFSDNNSTGEETITQVQLYLTAKGTSPSGCFSNNNTPNMWIERTSALGPIVENPENGDCLLSGTGVGRGDGPATTTTNRVSFDPTTVTDNELFIVDITDMFMDWWAVRSFRPDVALNADELMFSIVIKAQDESAGTSDKFAFWSDESSAAYYDGGKAPTIKITYTLNDAPTIEGTSDPEGRISGSSTVVYNVAWADGDGELPTGVSINVHTSDTVDGNGKMNAGTTLWDSGWVTPTTVGVYGGGGSAIPGTPSSGYLTRTHTGTSPTRGTQYYWQAKIRDAALSESDWSAPVAFDINEYPTGSSRDPG